MQENHKEAIPLFAGPQRLSNMDHELEEGEEAPYVFNYRTCCSVLAQFPVFSRPVA